MNILLIFLGGGIGALIRSGINHPVRLYFGTSFPYGILGINILGSFLIGIISGYLTKNSTLIGLEKESVIAFFIVGILGGFTTFSSFSMDVVTMLNDARYITAFTYVALSVVISIAAAFIGYALMK
jgi:CrcB protein